MTIDRERAPPPSHPDGHDVPAHLGGARGHGHVARSGGVDPSRLRAFLRRRAWTIVAMFALVMTGVVVMTLLMHPRYESTASFLVGQERPTNTEVPSLDVLQRMGQLANRETEVSLIGSRRVVEPVVDAGDLHVTVLTSDGPRRPRDVFSTFAAGPDAVPGTYEVLRTADDSVRVVDPESGDVLATAAAGDRLTFANVTAGPLLGPEADASGDATFEVSIIPFGLAIAQTQGQIEVGSGQRDAGLIQLTCSARTAEDARWLCSAISDSYLAMRSDLQRQEASAAADFLADQAKEVRGRLSAAEDSLKDFSERNQAVALDTKSSEEIRRNAEIRAEREQLIAERDALDALIRQIDSDPTPDARKFRQFAAFPTFLNGQNQAVGQLLANLVELDNRRNELAVHRTEKDPELAALDQRIQDVEEQIRGIAVGYAEALTERIRTQQETLTNSRRVLASIPAQQVESARLERQVSLLEDLYKFLESRLQEAQIARTVELPSVRVVDRASLPFEPSSPRKTLNLAVGAVLATMLGLMLALWQEYTDTRIREREAVEFETGLPVLGLVPALKHPGPVISLKHTSPNGGIPNALVPAWTAERALALEAFRTLSSDLGYVGGHLIEGGFRSVAVTSSTRGEGKTFTACNLAIARASHGIRTLLVDADLRGRGLSRFLDLPRDLRGLTEMLESDDYREEPIHTFEVGGGKALSVVPAGAGTPRGAELLEGDRFRNFLRQMEEHFDLVVCDTPPLNVVTDAAAVSAQVDGVVVVVRRGVTEREALELTLTRLDRAGGRVAGIVFNDALMPPSYTTYSHAE